jgi:hypothetical protein
MRHCCTDEMKVLLLAFSWSVDDAAVAARVQVGSLNPNGPDGDGGENKRLKHGGGGGGGGGESRQQTPGGSDGSSAVRVETSGVLPREIHQISLVRCITHGVRPA